jgi:hypothetical protein
VGGALALRVERRADEGAGASFGLSFLYAPANVSQPAERATIGWTAIAATACPPWSLGRTVTLQPCARAIGGWLSANGRNLQFPNSVTRSWWSAGALLRAGIRLGGYFSVELEAGATIPIADRTFTVDTPEETVGQTPTISPMVALGLSRSL